MLPVDDAGALHVNVEWTPALPQRLTDDEFSEYRRGRDKALAEICAELGIACAVREL